MIKIFEKYDVWIYIVLAYTFSLLIRMIWVFQFNEVDQFIWNNQFMLNTNDGYFFSSGVKNLIDESLINNQRVPDSEYGLVSVTYFFTSLLPFTLDTVSLYFPIVIASTIVIPIVLIMRLYNLTFIGFLAALLSSIAWSFYNRTMIGYYDTDLFALTLPVLITYFLIRSVKFNSLNSVLLSALSIALYFYLYDASSTVIYAIAMGYIIYLALFFRNNKNIYAFISLISIASLSIDWIVRIVLIIVLYVVFKKNIVEKTKYLLGIMLVSLIAFFYFDHVFSSIYSKIFSYVETGVDKNSELAFYQVHQTIREAGKIPFETFANRISGSIFTFIIALFGYLILVIKKREFLLFLPLIGIGFFAYIGGLRFTVYAIPAMSLGAVYLVYFIFNKLIVNIKIRYLLISLFSLALLYPNIMHIIAYKVPTVFNKQEVQALDKLKNIASNQDYTLAWWDYGYPIWYFSETNTLIDGGKHHHDNYIISKILTTSSSQLAANLARKSVEIYANKNLGYSPVAKYIFEVNGTSIDPSLILDEMSLSDYSLPKKTRDIYLYMPDKMLNIFPTVNVFSNLDLKTGKQYKRNLFYLSRNFKQNKNIIYLGNNIKLILDKGSIQIGKQIIKLNHFTLTEYNKSGKLLKDEQLVDINSKINVIYMKNYNRFLVLDNALYNSMYIQMFVLENYDKALFEPSILSPLVKIYKVKI